MASLTDAIIATIREYASMTENDRSTYRPEKLRHLTTLLEAAQHNPDNWEPLKEWVGLNLPVPMQKLIVSMYPKQAPKVEQVEEEETETSSSSSKSKRNKNVK